MPRVTVKFNQKYFDQIGKSAGVVGLTKKGAEKVLAEAKATAPVDSGDYKEGLHLERDDSRYRAVFLVMGDDWKTLLVEAWTGNLARALKKVARRG